MLEKRGKRSAGRKVWEEGERVEERNIERGRRNRKSEREREVLLGLRSQHKGCIR